MHKDWGEAVSRFLIRTHESEMRGKNVQKLKESKTVNTVLRPRVQVK